MAAADSALARKLGVAAAIIERARADLTEGEHYTRSPIGRVTFTEAGEDAIRARIHLPPAQKKEGGAASTLAATAPAAPPQDVMLRITRCYASSRGVQVRTPDGTLADVFVKNNTALRRHLALRCVQLTDGRWQCTHPGQAVPLNPLAPQLGSISKTQTKPNNTMGKQIVIIALSGTFDSNIAKELTAVAAAKGLEVHLAAVHYDGKLIPAVGTAHDLTAEVLAALGSEKGAAAVSKTSGDMLAETLDNTRQILAAVTPKKHGNERAHKPVLIPEPTPPAGLAGTTSPNTGPTGDEGSASAPGPTGIEGKDGPGPDPVGEPGTEGPAGSDKAPAEQADEKTEA